MQRPALFLSLLTLALLQACSGADNAASPAADPAAGAENSSTALPVVATFDAATSRTFPARGLK
jgi:hypothetical protein